MNSVAAFVSRQGRQYAARARQQLKAAAYAHLKTSLFSHTNWILIIFINIYVHIYLYTVHTYGVYIFICMCLVCCALSTCIVLSSPLPAAFNLTSFTKCLYKETCKLVQVPGWLHCAKRMLTSGALKQINYTYS